MKISFILYGAPRTKKNHGRVRWSRKHRRNMHVPSEAWEKWLHSCHFRPYKNYRISEPVNCAAIFYRDALRGDAVGYYQGLADVLEYYRIVADDKWIVSWDGSRLEKDTVKPRVEVTLESVK